MITLLALAVFAFSIFGTWFCFFGADIPALNPAPRPLSQRTAARELPRGHDAAYREIRDDVSRRRLLSARIKRARRRARNIRWVLCGGFGKGARPALLAKFRVAH